MKQQGCPALKSGVEWLGPLAMGQRHRRAVYGKSVRTVRGGDGGRRTSSYTTGWSFHLR